MRESPVTPAVLDWTLAQDGRSRSDIAAALQIPRADLDAWAEGTARPRVGQVTELAKLLHRPRVMFFLPRPPAEGALPDGFRHPPGGGVKAVSHTELLQARRSKRIQRAVAAIVDPVDSPMVPRASTRDAPEAAAAAVRPWLGIPEDAQWSSDMDALRYWRAALETAGVLVFQLQLGEDAVRGFAGWDDRAPMIVMNQSSVSPAARLFTLGHELAHLTLREATACLEPAAGRLSVDDSTERWCERFAGALLMPAPAVRRLMAGRGVGHGQADIDAVKGTMQLFRVSARASAVRLDDLGYAAPGLYGAVLSVFQVNRQKKSKRGGGSPPRHKLRVRQYGVQVVQSLLEALPPDDALSVLRMNVEDVRALADEVPGVSAT